MGYSGKAASNHQCVPLDQLSLCQNLEEFCGNERYFEIHSNLYFLVAGKRWPEPFYEF